MYQQPKVEFDITVYSHILQGKSNSEHVTQLPSGSSPAFSQSHSSYTAHNPGTASMIGDSCEPNQNFSFPGSLEVTFEAQALRQLEEQLSLNDDGFNEIALDLVSGQDQRVVYKQDKSAALSGPNDLGQPCDGYNGRQGNLDKLELLMFFLERGNKINICLKLVKHLNYYPILRFYLVLCLDLFSYRCLSSTYATYEDGFFSPHS